MRKSEVANKQKWKGECLLSFFSYEAFLTILNSTTSVVREK
jgi:hypothetical protein